MSRNAALLLSRARPGAVCRACRTIISRNNIAPISSSARTLESLSELELLLQDNYRPATTWDGLEWVGTKKWALDRKKMKHLEQVKEGKTVEVKPFTIAKLPENELERQLRNALIEVLVCKNMGIELEKLDDMPIGEFKGVMGLKSITHIANGQEELRPVILCATPEFREILLETFANHFETKFDTPDLIKLRSEIPVDSTGSWKTVPITSDVRFALLKRIIQRTGHRIPDCDLDHCSSAGAVHRLLIKPRKQPKLSQIIEDENKLSLPNVQTFPRRQKAMNKDISEGRWKIIRKALSQRKLPEFKHKVIRERDLPTEIKQSVM